MTPPASREYLNLARKQRVTKVNIKMQIMPRGSKKNRGSCTLTHKPYCKHRSKHRFCYMARAGTTKHLNMLFFGKIYVWRYVSPFYLLEFTTFAVDHDPNASLSCAFTWKPLNCRLNYNNCYFKLLENNRGFIVKICIWSGFQVVLTRFSLFRSSAPRAIYEERSKHIILN